MTTIMRNRRAAAKSRVDLKQESLRRILDAGARRIRTEGLDRAAIVPVMQDAGLTHGAFYSHFTGKDELAVAAFVHAITEGRPHWTRPSGETSWGQRLKRLAKRYLSRSHRDDLAGSCAFVALSADAARATPQFRQAYETELRKTVAAICEPFKEDASAAKKTDEAVALLALCVGGIALSRAVSDETFSAYVLDACQAAVARLADASDASSVAQAKPKQR